MKVDTMPNNIEIFLEKYARSLEPGEYFTLPLLKGPSTSSIDPVHAERVRREGGKTIHVEKLHFPRMAKFGETTNKPDFSKSWNDGRMYEEDIPKYKDESEEENGSTSDAHSQTAKNNRRKKRWKHKAAPKKHWIIQERSEFIEKIRVKKLQKKDPTAAAAIEKSLRVKLSKRYEGIPEYNPSQYAFLSITTIDQHPTAIGEETKRSLTLTPIYGFHSFLQPDKYETLSMKDAERAIQNQRDHISRYMMHGKFRTFSQPPCQSIKTRLFRKFTSIYDGDAIDTNNNDVMGDIAFRTGENRTIQAHHELISSFVDGDITVDGDGILGGANDAEFGGRRKFSKLSTANKTCDNPHLQLNRMKNTEIKTQSKITSTGFDGHAMEDNFYQRDVSAEYDDMDYDPNELFDDDDIDQGDVEVEDDTGGGASTGIDEEDDDDDDDVSLRNRGFESSAGTRLMLAKHNPDHILNHHLSVSERSDDEYKLNTDQIFGPTEISGESQRKYQKRSRQFVESGIQYDENGERVITLDSVRREIWLNRGSMGLIQLMKVYKISRKNQQRKNKLREIVRELCTVENKKAGSGTTVVLKQHYASMS